MSLTGSHCVIVRVGTLLIADHARKRINIKVTPWRVKVGIAVKWRCGHHTPVRIPLPREKQLKSGSYLGVLTHVKTRVHAGTASEMIPAPFPLSFLTRRGGGVTFLCPARFSSSRILASGKHGERGTNRKRPGRWRNLHQREARPHRERGVFGSVSRGSRRAASRSAVMSSYTGYRGKLPPVPRSRVVIEPCTNEPNRLTD